MARSALPGVACVPLQRVERCGTGAAPCEPVPPTAVVAVPIIEAIAREPYPEAISRSCVISRGALAAGRAARANDERDLHPFFSRLTAVPMRSEEDEAQVQRSQHRGKQDADELEVCHVVHVLLCGTNFTSVTSLGWSVSPSTLKRREPSRQLLAAQAPGPLFRLANHRAPHQTPFVLPRPSSLTRSHWVRLQYVLQHPPRPSAAGRYRFSPHA